MACQECSLAVRMITLCVATALLALTTSASQDQKSVTTSLCFSGRSHLNATGHWIAKATVRHQQETPNNDTDTAASSWTYDVEFRRVLVGNQHSLETSFMVTVPEPPPAVRADYQFHSGVGYHKLHKTPKNWAKAKKICEDEGAHLAIINSKDEEDVIKEILAGSTVPNGAVFIGFHDIDNEGEFLTVLGEPLSSLGYINWDTAEPRDPDGTYDCGGIKPNGALYVLRCNVDHSFLCEIPL